MVVKWANSDPFSESVAGDPFSESVAGDKWSHKEVFFGKKVKTEGHKESKAAPSKNIIVTKYQFLANCHYTSKRAVYI